MSSNKKAKMIAAIVAVLMISSTLAIMVGAPANAQTTLQQPVAGPLASGVVVNQTAVSAHLSFRPSPIGQGQTLLVNMWTSPAPGANRNHPEYIVTITKPNGDQEVKKMVSYVADGTSWFEYVPDQVGEYKLKFDFPGTYFPSGTYVSGVRTSTATTGGGGFFSGPSAYAQPVYYKPDSTPVMTLTVQQDMVYSWPAVPLPTDYWTRPIPFEFREWWPILGNWPWWGPSGGPTWDELYPDTTSVYNPRSQFTPWVQGPNSAHVVWKRLLAFEGIVGGDQGYGSLGYELSGYGAKPSLILFGRGFQTVSKASPTNQSSTTYWQSYDLRTGQVFWERPLYPGESAPNLIEYGTVSYSGSGVIGADITPGVPNLLSISGGFVRKYNPYTGVMTANVSISPLTSATYYMNGQCLSVQNLGTSIPADQRYRLINWTTLGTGALASRVSGNTSYAMSSLPSIIDYQAGYGAAVSDVSDQTGSYTKMRVIGYNLWTGAVTFNTTIDDPQYSGSANIADHGKVAVLSANGYYVAFDLATGNRAWTSEKMAYPWDSSAFGTYGVQSAYGLFYRQAYSYIYAFDWDTGKIAWKFTDPALFPFEGPYINDNGTTVYPFDATAIIADGKMFVYNAEHTPYTPYTRGWSTFAINATTGEKIWSVMIPGSAWFSSSDLAVADGYLSLGGADGYQYIFGRGKSATTVTASPKTITENSTVIIEGTVLDMSPAQTGTPCVSKDSMATQMEYLHRQFPIAGFWNNITLTGVPVYLSALDSNGNPVDIGTVTTNGYYGTFAKEWIPPMQGTYTIIASFAADDSYGSSSASTAVTVGPAPVDKPVEQPQQTIPDYSMILEILAAAVVVAIVIGVINLVVYLRKR